MIKKEQILKILNKELWVEIKIDGTLNVQGKNECAKLIEKLYDTKCSLCGSTNIEIETKGIWCSNCDTWISSE